MTNAGISTILMAANAEADQPWVADATAQLAKETDSQVIVVSVDELETELLATLPRSEFIRRAEEAATAAVGRLTAAGITAEHEVRSGLALENIIAVAQERNADIIVVGASVRGHITQRLLGSVPLALIQSSPKPVLVVTEPK